MFYVFIRQFKKFNKTRLCLLFFNVFFIFFWKFINEEPSYVEC